MYFEDTAGILDKLPPDERDRLENVKTSMEFSEDSDGDRFMAGQLFTDILRDYVRSNGNTVPDSNLLLKLAEELDSLTRINMLDQMNDVCLAFYRYGKKDDAYQITRVLLPSLLKFLTDEVSEVRTKSSLLLSTFMQYDLDKSVVEEEICPAIVEVSELYPPTGINLMGKLAFYLGEDMIEKFFLDKFISFCSDDSVYTRELCASNFGNVCEELGTETTEKKLLPIFVELCRDRNHGVRISCAEVFIAVTCTCSLETRRTILAPVFADLLDDPFQLVRKLTYRVLGAFICTFADPRITGLQCERNGEINFVSRDGFQFSFRSPKREEISNANSNFLSFGPQINFRIAEDDPGDYQREQKSPLRIFWEERGILVEKNELKERKEEDEENSSGGDNTKAVDSKDDNESGCNNSEDISSSSSSEDADNKVDDAFNTFRFWRTPLLETDLLELEPEQDEIRTNLNILDNELTTLSNKIAACSTKSTFEELKNKIKTETVISSASTPDSGWNSASTTPPKIGLLGENFEGKDFVSEFKFMNFADRSGSNDEELPRRGNCTYIPVQEIVPQLLLDYFVSMTEPLQSEKTDEDIAQHCAYFLPAVALTLGPDNWVFLRKAYKYLALDYQWKVRKTVASSIYELASILGEDIASRDLVPIFRGFVRDLDEVRIGALEHLADFLKFLDSDTRNMLLPLLKDFLKTDNDRNWRYREELGEQLRLSISLFSPVDCLKHLAPLATCLLCDKVAAVRQKALQLMSDLIVFLSDESHFQIALLDHLVEEFAEHSLWRRRQVFVLLCSELSRQKILDCETFATMMLGHLLKLSNDSIPNVGLCVARCLADDIVCTGYISVDSPHYKTIIKTLEGLKDNEDSDVRYYAGARDEEGEMTSLNNSWETFSPESAEFHLADSTTESTETTSETLETTPTTST